MLNGFLIQLFGSTVTGTYSQKSSLRELRCAIMLSLTQSLGVILLFDRKLSKAGNWATLPALVLI